MGEFPESYLPSRDIDTIRPMTRYRRSRGDELTALKNRVHALLARNGLPINASYIFGKRSLKKISDLSEDMPETNPFIPPDLISGFR
ncbi:MAG: hypothetical protein QXU18_00425 [Thermoplasmatales archaeon]